MPGRRPSAAAFAVVLGLFATAPSAHADDVADFYKGKTVRVVIGTGVGGTYGVYGQLVARHYGRFIPGHPTVVMQSMQGAGGFTALNWLGTAAPRDGTVVTIGHINIVHEGLFNAEAKFDPRGFLWLGRFTSFASIGVASKKSGMRSLADAKAREVAAGAPGAQSVPAQAPAILNKIAGTKFKVVAGYRSTGESFLALERGEVDVAATSMDALRSLYWPKLESGELTPIFVQGIRRLKEFPEHADAGRVRQHRRGEGVPRRVQRHRRGRPLAGDAAGHSGRPAGGVARGLPGDGRRPRVPGRHQEARHRA